MESIKILIGDWILSYKYAHILIFRVQNFIFFLFLKILIINFTYLKWSTVFIINQEIKKRNLICNWVAECDFDLSVLGSVVNL